MSDYADLQAIPVNWTQLHADTCVIVQVTIYNPTSNDITFSMRDGQAQALVPLDTFIVPAKSFLEHRPGLRFLNGVQWKASAAGLLGGMV